MELRAIRAWWDGLRGEHPLPPRSKFSPHALKPFLANIQLLDVLDDGRDFHIRVFGSQLVNMTGWDFTDRLLSQSGSDALRKKWLDIYTRVVTSRAPLSFTTNLNNVGREFMYVEELLLPFSRGSQAVECIVGAIVRRD